MILVDENISQHLIDFLINNNVDILSVRLVAQGATDKEVIDLAIREKRIILTEDKDFGEWVFAHGEDRISVIFLRYPLQDFEQICELLLSILQNTQIDLKGAFTTITPNKTRLRRL